MAGPPESGYHVTMFIEASAVVTIVAIVIVVVLGLLAAPAFRRTGDAAERMTPLGSGVPKLPEQDFERPRDEGG